MGEEPQWYTNKDIYEMVQALKTDFHQFRAEMQEINNLRTQIVDLQKGQLEWVQYKNKLLGKSSVGDGIRQWGGWFIAIISLIFSLWKQR